MHSAAASTVVRREGEGAQRCVVSTLLRIVGDDTLLHIVEEDTLLHIVEEGECAWQMRSHSPPVTPCALRQPWGFTSTASRSVCVPHRNVGV
jgi:hypothetical protein